MKTMFTIRLNVRALVNTYNEYVYEYGGETMSADDVYTLLKSSTNWHGIFEYGPRYVWLKSEAFENFMRLLIDNHYNDIWVRTALCDATKISFM